MDTDTKHGSSRAVERFMELWGNGNTSPLSWELCKHGLGFPPATFNAAAIAYTQQSPENMVNFLEWAYKVADRLAACNAREDEYMVEIERLREQRLHRTLAQAAACVGKIEVRRGDDCKIYLTLTGGEE